MSEAFQTRTEHSRSLEDAEKFRALDTLKELGLLIPVADVETYHGRVGDPLEAADWTVDPTFANGSNDSGNNNVNSRSTLYTGDRQTAQDFADSRAQFPRMYVAHLRREVDSYTPEQNIGRLERQNDWVKYLWEERVARANEHYPAPESPDYWTMDKLLSSNSFVEAQYLSESRGEEAYNKFKQQFADQKTADIHEIVTADTDATILDLRFDETKLDDQDRVKYHDALKALILPVTEGSPVSFDDRDAVQPVISTIQKANKAIIRSSEVAGITESAGTDERVVVQLCGAFNASQIAQTEPSYLVREFIHRRVDLFTTKRSINGEEQEIPLNLEYVQRYLREAHIVGVIDTFDSATLGRDIEAVSFFDLEKTTTAEGLETERSDTWQRLGGTATGVGQAKSEMQPKQPLLRLLSNVYAKPDKLVAAAKTVAGYDKIYDADAGNWEGYTLAEHTETVLRNFDESYAEDLPVELLAPMRLAILSHDLGKPQAAANGEKHKQMDYNIAQAGEFFAELGVDDKLQALLLAVIGEGEELAFQIDVRGGGQNAENAMRELAAKTMQRFYDSEQVTEDQITGFTEMCKMLQICDGGAYTSMAITNRGGGRGHYRNAPSFNNTFAQPAGFGKRTIRLRKAGDKPADYDLTPKSTS